MVVCTHGVRVVRVRFPAVRHETRNPYHRIVLKRGFLYTIYTILMQEEKQEKSWISPLLLIAIGILIGWLLFGYNQHAEKEEVETVSVVNTQEQESQSNEEAPDGRPAIITDPEQALIRDALGLKDPRSKAVVTHQSGQFFIAEVRVPIEASPTGWGGGHAILKKEGDRYRALYKGQENPPCDVVEEENIPNEIVESLGDYGCWDDEVGWRKPK